MTRTVWNYRVDLSNGLDPVLEIPGGGHFLTLKDPVLEDYRNYRTGISEVSFDTWWAVDTDSVPVEVQLHIRETLDEVPPSTNYLGSLFPLPGTAIHVWQKDRVFQDMHIVDGKFVPKSHRSYSDTLTERTDMKDWLKKNRDAILITGVAITATVVTAAVSYKIADKQIATDYSLAKLNMANIANGAGVLDKIIEHQEKLVSIVES